MINKNYTNEIRTCERIKFDQALYILTMYEKKIRKNRQNIYKKTINHDKGVDADQELEDITYAWKNKWKMDLTKPVLNCVTSVYPRILIDYSPQTNPKLQNFYKTISQFIKRMRAQHQDQTNYKFVLNNYDKSTMIDDCTQFRTIEEKKSPFITDQQEKSQHEKLKLLNCSKAAVNSILNVTYNMTRNCIRHFQENFQFIINQDISDVDTQGLQWQVIRPLRYIREITRRAIFGNQQNRSSQQMQDEDNNSDQSANLQPESQQASELATFVHNTIKLMQKIKQSQHGSTLITIQPQIRQLTYVIHPLLAAIYATFKKQNLEKQKDFDWKDSVPVETKTFMENVKNSYNFSKIVLINLDGYESEFNLELVRNFRKHLMYISFPKQQAKLTDLQKVYSLRFFKKLMFKHTQASYQSYPTQNLSQDMKHLSKLQQLNYNPQNYHHFVQQMYQPHLTDRPPQDFNQNMYIFPIRYKALKQNFPEMFPQTQKEDIQMFESYFIRFVMKDFLINQIREFNPSYVMISYSGRIVIDDGHFVQMIQQLTKVANYKLLFYPNLTTAFCQEEMMQTDDIDGNQCDYDNAIYDKNIQRLLNCCRSNSNDQKDREDNLDDDQQGQRIQQQQNENPCQQQQQPPTSILQLFNKIARFLKVSSGTYNLTRSQQQDTLISKFKNQFILAYTDEIMTCLGKQYYSMDRIRFKNKDLTIIPKLFEQNLNAIKKSFPKTVPQFYCDLYKVLEVMLFSNSNNSNKNINSNSNKPLTKQHQQLINLYKVNVSDYQQDVLDLWQQLTKSSSIDLISYQKQEGQTQQDILSSGQMKQEGDSRNQKKDLIQQIQEIKLRKNRQKFMSLKQLHFIQISTQKYDQKITLYIKKKPQHKQFTQITQQSQQTQGLYDVTFLRKDRTQIKLFQNTKILYKHDQQHRENNNIPVLIMNNLSDEKPGHFQNYFAELDVSQEENKQRKNIQEKKALAIPIVLKQDENNNVVTMKTFVVKSDWNFCQTTNHIILFWPTQFDFLRAIIYKMLNKTYSPTISNSIYISKKSSSQKHIFRKVRHLITRTMVLPRMGCSSYEFQERLFIFGGFYDRQKNYLNFQHDITMFDLRSYMVSNQEKMSIQNLKSALYSQQNFTTQLQTRNSYNSFIRPKMQFEIFDKSQLTSQLEQDPSTKDVILFGGYGQNFLRPYSMLTYYYYQIKFSHQTHNILTINKKFIYDKTVPINVRQMTKNLGIIKTNKKNPNTNVLEANKITEPGSYLTFRNSFRLEKNADNVQDLKYKTRYMFAEDQYKSFKNQVKRVQQQRTQQFDSSTISVEKMQGNNHLISLEKDGKKCVISLHLQIPHQKAKKLGCSRQVKLTHQSIIYIDFWNSMICAIIKHDFYTRGKSVLVEYNIKSLQNLSFNHDQIPHIALTWIKQFDINLNMHILIACNKNTIAILHGQKLMHSQKVKQFIVKKKKNKTEAVAHQIQQRTIYQLTSSMLVEYCYSIFFKQRNKILCLQYLSDHNNATIIEIAHEIQLNSANDTYNWQTPSQKTKQQQKSLSSSNNINSNNHNQNNKQSSGIITHYRIIHPQTSVTLPLHKLSIIQYLKVQKQQHETIISKHKTIERIIEVQYNKKMYYLELGALGSVERTSHVEVVQMIPVDNLVIEKENVQRGTILCKRLEQYEEIL